MDIMRLSIIVRNNLEKEAEAKEYDAASSAGAPKGDVKLHHTDAELDFEEQAADAAGLQPPHAFDSVPSLSGKSIVQCNLAELNIASNWFTWCLIGLHGGSWSNLYMPSWVSSPHWQSFDDDDDDDEEV